MRLLPTSLTTIRPALRSPTEKVVLVPLWHYPVSYDFLLFLSTLHSIPAVQNFGLCCCSDHRLASVLPYQLLNNVEVLTPQPRSPPFQICKRRLPHDGRP